MSSTSTTHPRTSLVEVSVVGEFKRVNSVWRSFIAKDSTEFPPEPNRYHLIVSLACPWACRALAAINLKGLQKVIGVSVVHPTWQRTRPDSADDTHCGWVFRQEGDAPLQSSKGHGSFSCEGCVTHPDFKHFNSVRDLYVDAGDQGGKYSVPVLYDLKKKTIVNNESSEILRMLNTEFDEWGTGPSIDLYPSLLREKIDEVNGWVYNDVNNGVYRCGFAQSQSAYDVAIDALMVALYRLEELLSKSRYLVGDELTEADVRLFVTLIRFDEVYVVYFKCNVRSIREFPHLLDYLRDIYQTPGIKESVNFKHIKEHYFSSHPTLNPYAVVPRGPAVDYDAPHSRHLLSKKS